MVGGATRAMRTIFLGPFQTGPALHSAMMTIR
jgi:hypothetical protein